MFRLGRLMPQPMVPGLFLMIPIVDQMVRIDLRTVTLTVPPQEVITTENVPARVTATAVAEVPVEEAVRVAALRAALRGLLHRSEQTARAHGLTLRQQLLLRLIKERRPQPADDRDRAGRTDAACPELGDRAGRSRRRRTGPARALALDGRVSFLWLTGNGEHWLAQVFSGLAEERARLLAAIESTR